MMIDYGTAPRTDDPFHALSGHGAAYAQDPGSRPPGREARV